MNRLDCSLERGFSHFDNKSFPEGCLRTECSELVAELFLGGSPLGSLQGGGLQAHGDLLAAVEYPAVTMGDRIETESARA